MHQEDITIISSDAPNIAAPKYIKQILTERNFSFIFHDKTGKEFSAMEWLVKIHVRMHIWSF